MGKDQTNTATATTTEVAPFAIDDTYTLTHRKAVAIKAGDLVDIAVTLEKLATSGEDVKTGFRVAHDGATIEAETENKLIDALVANAAGVAIKKASKSNPDGYTVEATANPNGKAGWQSVANDAEPEMSDENKARLDALAVEINAQFSENIKAAKANRERAIKIGAELAEAQALFYGDSETPNTKAAWGRWVKTSFPAILKRAKNFVAEHMLLARFPAEYWAFADESKASAKSLEAWHNNNRASFAAYVAESFVGRKVAKDNKLLATLQKKVKASSFEEVCKATATGEVFLQYANDIASDQAAGHEKAFAEHGYDMTVGLNAKGQTELAIGLAGAYLTADDIGKYYAKALEKELFEYVNAKSPAEQAEEEKEKTRESATATARGFVNFTPQEAAEHIARILMARDDCFEVLDMVEAALETALTKAEEAEAQAEQDAENTDQEDIG